MKDHSSVLARERNARFVLAAVALVLALVLSGCSCSNNNDYASEDDAGYLGTWVGKLESTTTGPACFAGQDNPIEITVKNVETTGRMVMDVKVLYHGHSKNDLPGDVDSFQGDKMVTLADQTTSLNRESFNIVADQDDGGKLTIDGTWTGIGDSLALEVRVKSQDYPKPVTEDKYTLTKK